jgi:hypothetical protein
LVTLLNAESAQIDIKFSSHKTMPIGQPKVFFDQVIVENAPSDKQSVAKMLRPIFDQLANAGDRRMSQNFSEDGSWIPPEV